MSYSQNQQILNHLQKGNGISQVLAFKMFGCWRLAARIDDLRKSGFNIKTQMVEHGGKRFALYTLVK